MIRAVLSDWGHTLFDTAGSIVFLERWAAERGLAVTTRRISSLYHSAFAQSRSADELAKGRAKSAERHRECWLSLWADLDRERPDRDVDDREGLQRATVDEAVRRVTHQRDDHS